MAIKGSHNGNGVFNAPDLWRSWRRSRKRLGLVGLLPYIKMRLQIAQSRHCLLWIKSFWFMQHIDVLMMNYPVLFGQWWQNILYGYTSGSHIWNLVYLLFRYIQGRYLIWCQKPWVTVMFGVFIYMFWNQSCRIMEWRLLSGIPGFK